MNSDINIYSDFDENLPRRYYTSVDLKIAILTGASEFRLLERPKSPEPANKLTEGNSSTEIPVTEAHSLQRANESRLLERPKSPEPANELTEGDSSAGRPVTEAHSFQRDL
ncbi:hypothetical protein Glove_212g177 [Diversispora epigaea]|uniref:Uncharacterized protein n=1 Tax=Diversispora epigaea TaxID=1348612 RepID=A0A397II64_9GLOM|nr:hypothetical protein Glove_212g177 [Diversispora epigaea]